MYVYIYFCIKIIYNFRTIYIIIGLPCSSNGKESACNAGDLLLDPWVRRIFWRRQWQSTPVLLLVESHRQRSLEGYSSWGHKESDMTERLTLYINYTINIISYIILMQIKYIQWNFLKGNFTKVESGGQKGCSCHTTPTLITGSAISDRPQQKDHQQEGIINHRPQLGKMYTASPTRNRLPNKPKLLIKMLFYFEGHQYIYMRFPGGAMGSWEGRIRLSYWRTIHIHM